jgi:putative oxidoreductase
MQKLDSWSPTILSILRIIIGLLFLEHGTQKVLHFPPAPPPPVAAAAAGAMKAAAAAATHAAAHAPTLAAVLGRSSGYFELIGGALIVVGLLTRVTAFVLSGEMAFAYFLAHAPRGFFPIGTGGNGGELAIIYCFIFLYFVFSGPGPISLDGAFGKKA